MPQRWTRSERSARVANGFEQSRGAEGLAVSVTMQAPVGGFTGQALQEAYDLGRRARRG